jgi:hypothetical protein
VFSIRMFATVATVAVSVATVWGQPRSATSWGSASGGLQLGITASGDGAAEGGVAVEVSFKNVGPNDFVLNLGIMLANGKVMFPDAVRVNLTGRSAAASTCELKYVDRRYSGIAGRVDDFVVALPVGAVYTIRLTGDRLWCAATSEFQATLAPGQYRVSAHFEGRGAGFENLDMKGVALLNFWKGAAASGDASFEVGRRVEPR